MSLSSSAQINKNYNNELVLERGPYMEHSDNYPDQGAKVTFFKNSENETLINFKYHSHKHKQFGRHLKINKDQVLELINFLSSQYTPH